MRDARCSCETTNPLWAMTVCAGWIADERATGATCAEAPTVTKKATQAKKIRVIGNLPRVPAEAGTRSHLAWKIWPDLDSRLRGNEGAKSKRGFTAPVRDRPGSAACRWRRRPGWTY